MRHTAIVNVGYLMELDHVKTEFIDGWRGITKTATGNTAVKENRQELPTDYPLVKSKDWVGK